MDPIEDLREAVVAVQGAVAMAHSEAITAHTMLATVTASLREIHRRLDTLESHVDKGETS